MRGLSNAWTAARAGARPRMDAAPEMDLMTASPLRVESSIARPFRALRVHVEYILPAPALRGRVVLFAAHAPLPRIGQRIDGDAPQKLDLLPFGALQKLHALHQLIERLRVSVGSEFDLDFSRQRGVFVIVDGLANLAQR